MVAAREDSMAGNRSKKKVKNRSKLRQAAKKRNTRRHKKSTRRGMRAR
jgi:hypothetical protein